MKKFSLLTQAIVVSLMGMTMEGIMAVIDGTFAVSSSDESVLSITPLEDNLFKINFIGVGSATLTVSADADLGDQVRTITQQFDFAIYDQNQEADHIDLTVLEIIPRKAVTNDDRQLAASVGDTVDEMAMT